MPNPYQTLGNAPITDDTDYLTEEIQFDIDSNMRTIAIPTEGVVIGVQGDKNVNRVNFRMPAWYNGFDMSTFQPRINFVDPEGNVNYYTVTDMKIYDPDNNEVTGAPTTEDIIYFTWLVDSYATNYVGTVVFNVRFSKFNPTTHALAQAFNTTKAACQVLEGITLADEITQEQQEDLLFHMTAELQDVTDSLKLELEAKRDEVIDSIPDDYTTLGNDVTTIKRTLGIAPQYVNPDQIEAGKYWASVGTKTADSGWKTAAPILNLPAGTYYFCGVNPTFSWVVNRSNNTSTALGNLYTWTDTNYYKKHSVTIPYDFDLYLSRQAEDNYTEVLKFSAVDFDDIFSYDTALIDRVIKLEETGISVFPTIVTDDTVSTYLSNLDNALDNTLYRISVNDTISNLPSDYIPDSYYLVTLTNVWQNTTQKKQIMLTVNGGIEVKWVRFYESAAWTSWRMVNSGGGSGSNPNVNKTIIYVGSSETYKNIDSALSAITDNSESKQYKIIVRAGVYNVPSSSPYFGVKNYVDIEGEDKTTVIVQNIYSTSTYDDGRATFDPALYNQTIMSATLSNMTIISQGCKCPIHIDGTAIGNGGKIRIDNCILMDLNTPSNYVSNTQRFTRIGGVNCGLGNGQTVEVTNTISNGTLYAHNQSPTTTPSTFIIDHCMCRGTLIGCAYDVNVKDNYIVTNSKLDYIAIQTLYATSNKYNITLSNNEVNYIFAPSDDNITDPYGAFDTLFDGKCGLHEASCVKLMFNAQSETIERGSIVYFVTDQYNKGYLSDTFIGTIGTNLAGVAMEDIPTGKVGWVQYTGKISIGNITNAQYGDLIDFASGSFTAHTSGNTPIGVYCESSPLYSNQSMLKLF